MVAHSVGKWRRGGGIVTTLEEVMEEAQAAMQQMSNDAELLAFLIGNFYEMVADEKIENLRVLHNA